MAEQTQGLSGEAREMKEKKLISDHVLFSLENLDYFLVFKIQGSQIGLKKSNGELKL